MQQLEWRLIHAAAGVAHGRRRATAAVGRIGSGRECKQRDDATEQAEKLSS